MTAEIDNQLSDIFNQAAIMTAFRKILTKKALFLLNNLKKIFS